MSETDKVMKDLYKLIGNYESTSKTIFTELKEIKTELKEFKIEDRIVHLELKECITELQHSSSNQNSRITEIEEKGVPKRTSNKIDASLIIGVLNGIVTIVKAFIGIS